MAEDTDATPTNNVVWKTHLQNMVVNIEQRQDHLLQTVIQMQADVRAVLETVRSIAQTADSVKQEYDEHITALKNGVRSLGERQDYLIASVQRLVDEGEKAKVAFDQFLQGGVGKMLAGLGNPLGGLLGKGRKVIDG